jgi:coenzyme F420-reducing hydrogenase alpha subunit
MTRKDIHINVPVLARVEGEGALELDIRDNQIHDLKLRIYEPPRFFEKFLEGRHFTEIPDIVARICGICPVAYQMSAVHALEHLFELSADSWVRAMRRLMYCGEWIESHALHIHLLAAPDYFGFESVVAMAEKYPDEVRRGLKLQHLGNRIIAFLGGRSVHPVSVCAGGFTSAPDDDAAAALCNELQASVADARALLEWTLSFDLPFDNQVFTSVALHHPDEYPMNEGRIISSAGLDIAIDEYQRHFTETHMPHSTALYSHLHGKPYLVGPLARMSLNYSQLPNSVRDVIEASQVRFPSQNMFHSMIARAAEIYFALLEAIQLLQNYQVPRTPAMTVTPRSGIAIGCTEAPRGILWHRYEINNDGDVLNATIVPPTSQNQARIEEDLRFSLAQYGLNKTDDELRLRGEMVIRNYDPCISCATHFLKMKVQRT